VEALYVLEPGSYIRKDGDSLKIVKEGAAVADIPACGLKRLTLVGYVSLSGSVLDFLIRRRIETVFMTPTGRFRARLMLDEHPHVARRQAQYARLSEKGFALAAARRIVAAKLENQVRHLRRRARDHGIQELDKIAVRIHGLQRTLRNTQDLEVARGVEGYGTRLYFEAFPFLLRNDLFSFTGRTRRPPTDPVNAMLSFVYTLLTNEVLGAIKAAGLDPYLGALHEIAPGRPSLACDLVEEWRVLGDRLVLGLINRKYVTPDDFVVRSRSLAEKEPDRVRSVEMKPAALRALIASYEKQMQTRISAASADGARQYRWLIHEQVRRFAKCLEEGEPAYAPFCLSS
jgi:CRISPR-associated protein Cas1